jgi:predicted branched-subunit amino acid permease
MRPLNRTPDDPATDVAGTDPVLPSAIPVALAVGAYGVSYGVLAVAAGLSPAVALLSSVIVLAGGSQFAFVGVLAVGGNPFAGAVGGLLLNTRLIPFGLAIARHLPPAPLPRRLLDSYLVVDESVALALAGPQRGVVRRFRITAWCVIVAWLGATALGAYGGQLLGDPRTLGLDAAFPAGFLALLAPWLRTKPGRIAAATGTLLALALTPITPPGVPIIAASLGAVVALRFAPALPAEAPPATQPSEPSRSTPPTDGDDAP